MRVWLGVLALALFPVLAFAGHPPKAAIVMESASGRVLYAEAPDRTIRPASMTKMMTLYLLFEALEEGRLKLDSRLKVSKRAAGMPASKLGLRAGERIRVEEAIYALIAKSANDVAVVVAEALAGSEAAFARRMTQTARRLGMRRTVFRNASGLHHPGQRSTVRDMARLARALITDFPQFYPYFSTKTFTWRGRRFVNTNRLLGRYPGLDGLKTGFVRASGYNLAASAKRGGERLIVVVAGGRNARERDRKVIRLFDRGFAKLERLKIARIPPPRPKPAWLPAAVEVRIPLPASRPPMLALPRGELAAGGGSGHRERTPRAQRAYGIQVGAFLRPAQADAAAREALRLLPELLLEGEIDVSARKGRRKIFYRARIAGLEQRVAEAACRALKSRGRDCLVITYGPPLAVAAR